MWISSIRFRVTTKDKKNAGTDNLVTITLTRDGDEIRTFALNHSGVDDLERGAVQDFVYSKLTRDNDATPIRVFPDGSTPDYPPFGIEFSNGMKDHCSTITRIHGEDMWIEDRLEFFVKKIRLKSTGSKREWKEDTNWLSMGVFSEDVAFSTESGEGDEEELEIELVSP